MKPEQSFYKLLKPNIPGHAERVENVAGAGMPDFFCIYNGSPFWIECKAPTTKKWNLLDLLEPSQKAWRVRYLSHGGDVFYVVRSGSEIHLFDGHLNLIEKLVKPFDWPQFKLEITLKLFMK